MTRRANRRGARLAAAATVGSPKLVATLGTAGGDSAEAKLAKTSSLVVPAGLAQDAGKSLTSPEGRLSERS